MKVFIFPYCDICDAESHDISHCVEFRAMFEDFRTRGIEAATNRFIEKHGIEQFKALEEAMYLKHS